jgi:hypothetical protein
MAVPKVNLLYRQGRMRLLVLTLAGLSGCTLLLDFDSDELACSEDQKCSSGYSCLGEYCVADGSQGEGEACYEQRQCALRLSCADFTCRRPCEKIFAEQDECGPAKTCTRVALVDGKFGGACLPADPACDPPACQPTRNGRQRTCTSLDDGVLECLEQCVYTCNGSGCTQNCGLSDDNQLQTCQPVLNNGVQVCVPNGDGTHHAECDYANKLCASGNVCVRPFGQGQGYCLKLCDPAQAGSCNGALDWDNTTPTTCQSLPTSNTFGVCGSLPP